MHILVGVSGCIAAYKACELVRQLQKEGCDVSVVMTAHAQRFVGLDTFRALTDGKAYAELFGASDPIPHIHLAEQADALIIAPATANVCAKLAGGVADDLLTSTALACTCPVFVAPAMNVHMYENPATQANLRTLTARGIQVLAPDSGYLACGEVGPGKLPDPQVIAQAALEQLASDGFLQEEGPLGGRRVLITSGPTVEPIDPVRFISNRSSGKMGAALVTTALEAGAEVTVVTGPVSLAYDSRAQVIPVMTAQEMFDATCEAFEEADIAICAAAVSDFRPKELAACKLKKGRDDAELETITLVENPDILSWLGHAKREDQVVVGFAAETEDALAHGHEKLNRKGADIMVVNDVAVQEVFGSDLDAVTILTGSDEIALKELPKTEVARQVIGIAASTLHLK